MRYYAYDFLIGSPILIDRELKTLSLYSKNLYGQIYNLNNPSTTVVDAKMINSLIRRTGNENYGFSGNSKVIDSFIYEHLMTPEQQARCRRKPKNSSSPKIVATDDFMEAVQAMCEWTYDYDFGDMGETAPNKEATLKYCRDFIAGQKAIPQSKPSLQTRLEENKKKAARTDAGTDAPKTKQREV
jgi:hypothetical protein